MFARAAGDRGVPDQRGLDLHRGEPVPGHVEHVVDAAQDPEVAVLVAPRPVAREVHPGDLGPVLFLEALVVAPDGSQHGGPRPAHDEIAAGAERDQLPAAAGDGGAAAFLRGPASFANVIPMPGTIPSDAVTPGTTEGASS